MHSHAQQTPDAALRQRIPSTATDVLPAAEWERGFGMASVRFICGTRARHLGLERRTSKFLGTDATILFSTCFDANDGVFESIFGADDAIISDELNHASLIDGIRLSKAKRLRYKDADMDDLRAQLEAAKGARQTIIVTDGLGPRCGIGRPARQTVCERRALPYSYERRRLRPARW